MNRFVDDLAEHFRLALPEHHAALGPDGTRETIRHGVARARAYGITTARGVTVYVRLLFLFGRDYDTNPELPWAGAVLGDPALAEEDARVDQLALAARFYLEALTFESPP
ncbi:hypothetical protein UCMB321_2932 [Pseudomonas batumici]|uniref:Uncharacterized protein n=2 Tax=Pseudomonas batumici TaxID=226910 RepID=A0A0C2I2E8_9PSED|nr:hypothetical protein UCMB321_2932 [Pseudomonas batumici]